MNRPIRRIVPLLVLCALTWASFFLHSNRRVLSSVHEARVIETAREMDEAGDWIKPMFCGEIRLQKPPLPYWGSLIGSRFAGGFSLRAARLVLAALAIVMTLATWAIAAAMTDETVALAAAAILAASFLFHVEFRKVTPDPYLGATCTVAIALLAWSWRSHGGIGVVLLLAGYAASGLAILAKGPIAIAFVVFGAWAVRPSPVVRRFPFWMHLVGAAIAFAPLTLWGTALLLRVPDAIGVWKHELGKRLDHGGDDSRPFWTYGGTLALLVLPATIPFLAGFSRPFAGAGRVRTWFLVGLLFLLFLSSRKDAYMLPLAPAAAILAARALVPDGVTRSRLPAILGAIQAFIVAGGTGCVLALAWAGRAELGVYDVVVVGLVGLSAVVMILASRSFNLRLSAMLSTSVLGMFLYHGVLRSFDSQDWTRCHFGAFVGRAVPPEADFVAAGAADPVVLFYARRTPRIVADISHLEPGVTGETWILTTENALATQAPRHAEKVARVAAPADRDALVLLRLRLR